LELEYLRKPDILGRVAETPDAPDLLLKHASIGGLTTDFTTLLSQRSQARAGMIAHDLARREDLVRDFIIAASKGVPDLRRERPPMS
jgi:hypothetical protein